MRPGLFRFPRATALTATAGLVASLLLATGAAGAPPPSAERAAGVEHIVSKPVRPYQFVGDLRALPAVVVDPAVAGRAREADDGGISIQAVTPPEFLNPAPNFNGIGYTALVPPDTVGDVGRNHYIQMVNSQYQIFNKAGTSLAGPTNINQLWVSAGAGGFCQANNNGDPYVLYDHLADRWVMSQFAVPNGFGTPPTAECIAVSRTADPVAGGWYLYEFQFNFAHDYPKLGLWPDGYYMSSQRGFSGGQLNAVVFDRANMLNGNPATFQSFTSPGPALIWLPSDLDGPAPPAGTPNFFSRHVDGNQWGGTDRVDIMAFAVDWGNPANSSFTALPSLNTAPFDSNLCATGNLFDNCVPQPSTSVLLETLPHWAMGPLQYRNFGTYETLVFNHTVDADGTGHAGIRWYELRRPTGGAWTIHQQGTFSPDAGAAGLADDPWRWMGSVAMDSAGNMALGYSASSGTLSPEVRYAGRLATDPLGLMPHGEVTLVAGGNSQIINGSRWGDYSAMRVDPVDGCTFWYTQEYITAGSPFGPGNGGAWGTRIGAFRFGSCNAADLSISKTDSPDPVQAGGTLTYQVTVRNNGPATATDVTVTDTLPAGTTYVASTDSCVEAPAGTLTCDLGDMTSGQVRTFSIQVTVGTGVPAGTVLTNTATVTAAETDPNTSNNTATATTFVTAAADLRLSKLCKPDGPVLAGGTGTCTILVENLGPSDAHDVTITDTLVSNGPFTFGDVTLDVAGTCSIVGNTVTCTVATVPAGGRVTMTVAVSATEGVDVNDTASVSSSTPDPDMSNNTDQGSLHFAGVSDLSIAKTDTPDPVVAGTDLTYTLTVTNHGPSTAPNVVMTDTLPGLVSVQSVTPSQGSCNAGIPGNPLQPLTCALGALPVSGSATVTVVVRVSPATADGTVIENNSAVSSDSFDPDNGNNLATALTTVQAQADLAITKTSDQDTYKPSSTITYTITVVNNGPSNALAVVVTDNLPTTRQALYLSDTGGCTMAGLTLTCNVGDMAVGESRSFNIYMVVKGSRGQIVNTASVDSATADPNPANDSATRIVTVSGKGN